MVLKTTKKDNETIISIHSLSSDVSEKNIKQTFSTLLQYIIYNYMDKKDTYIPYVGLMNINHDSDRKEDGLAEAKLTITIDACDFLKRVVGQIDDNVLSDIDEFLLDQIGFEIEKHLEK